MNNTEHSKEYHKIETLFERDMLGSKKLIEGAFRNPAIQVLKSIQWIFTEKIDGTNVRVHWDGHKVSFGGRTDNAQLPAPLTNRLNELFLGQIQEELFEQKFGEKSVTFYGEGYGGAIQKGSGYKETQDFILFDVMVGDSFLGRENVENIGTAFGLDVVPVVLIGSITDAVSFVKTRPKSTVAKGDKLSEGLVGIPPIPLYDQRKNRLIVKIKVNDF